ncbi:MAG: hypothetical protein PWQ18_1025 [Clostridia bacterium]|nr:hypothetical protein [Clostridia bacterium]
MRAFKYFCLGLILGAGLTWGWYSLYLGKNKAAVPALPALAPTPGQQQAPFAIIFDFYQALSAGREEQAAALVTPDWQPNLTKSSLWQKWQQRRQEDPSLRFVFFLLKEQGLDPRAGTAWARGSAEWVSSRAGNLSLPQTVTLVNLKGQWKIKNITEQE